ncbi:hypothetical protein FH608_050540 [Nonomuraea phyllanthi]|uniref:Uncharacterized protein n=1 Tax=Nonomuraea phyllanthi TaxID=2219224 RepID=A0A5C4UU94_9ACTN|nr:hypothetical protein [Nonomuraea phyllanthi]KAB8181845.1 hypothetical protein FH608_050540 [Nonomuraea phyllanthi]
MAELIRSVYDEAPISYGRFGLYDVPGHGRDVMQETEHGALLAEPEGISLGALELVSPASARLAAVQLEAWDAEPEDEPGQPWAEAGRVLYWSPGGIVAVSGMGYSPTGQKLLLGPPCFAYWLSAYTGSVHSEPASWDPGDTVAVEERWLLRFWPVADVAGPALRGEDDSGYMARMREILALESGTAPPRPQAWAALRPHPQPDTATVVMRFNPPGPERATVRHLAKADSSSETAGGRMTVSSVDVDDDAQLVHEVLGDLLYDVLGNLPQNVWSWSRSMLEDYAAQLRVDRRIGRELNPDGSPTLVLKASSVRTPFFGAEPGFSGRAWVWGSEENGHADVLSVDREVIARDRIRQNTLFTGIVTILRKENDFVEVRAATQAEAARVIDVERLRG